jgi:hypothetical protein
VSFAWIIVVGRIQTKESFGHDGRLKRLCPRLSAPLMSRIDHEDERETRCFWVAVG